MAWLNKLFKLFQAPSPEDRIRDLHEKELTKVCDKCGEEDTNRKMMEGGWDGSQIAVCKCGHRWLLESDIDDYLKAIGPVTSGRKG